MALIGSSSSGDVKSPKQKIAEAFQSAIASGSSAASSAVASANSNIELQKQGLAGVTGQVQSARQQSNKISGYADDILATNYQIQDRYNALLNDASTVRSLATQYAPGMRDYASSLSGMANTLWDQGTGLVGQGQSLLDLDASGGGLVGEYVSWLKSIDPDKYVSMAAADVQNAYNNTQGQMIRSLTRAGADASSTRTASFQQQFQQGLAAALAGAKTRARQQGNTERGAALAQAFGLASDFMTKGLSAQAQGAATQAQAAEVYSGAYSIESDAVKSAAAIEAQASELLGMISNNYKAAGELSSIAAGITLDSAKVIISAYGNVDSAYKALISAQSAQADYNAKMANTYASMSGSRMRTLFGNYGGGGGGGSGSGGSVSINSGNTTRTASFYAPRMVVHSGNN